MSEEQKVVEITEEVKEAAQEKAADAAEAVQETAEAAAETVEETAAAAENAAEEVKEAAEEKAEEITDFAADKAEEATQTAEEATKAAAEGAGEAAEQLKEAAGEIIGKAAEAIGQISSFVGGVAGKVVGAAVETVEKVKEAMTETVGAVADAFEKKEEEPKESMEDFKEELEASYRKIKKGDIVTGTVINVSDTDVTIDFNYYAPGRIPAEEMSNDPSFSLAEDVKVGDTLSASVLKTDDGNGNMLLSCKAAANELAWDKLKEAMEEKKVYHGKISSVVKGGAVMYVEGIRGFIPASKLALGYVEDTNSYLNQEIDVQVIEVSRPDRKVVLSARDLLRRKAVEEKNRKMKKFAVGTVLEGKVESLKDYGAFVDLGEGVSGLLHVSQISDKRIAKPSQVLKVGDVVKVKITKAADGKLSLSMREANDNAPREADDDTPREYSDGGSISTGLGALLSKLNIGK